METDKTVKKLAVSKPILVEGKYDKIKLSSIIDATIITTDGFSVFKDDEKKNLIKKIAEKNGIIVITDSDGAGLVIRNYINSLLPKSKIIHLYIPEISGKEKRKKSPSKAGFIGVEGIKSDKIRKIFEPFTDENFRIEDKTIKITKQDFFSDGLSGGTDSSAKRALVAKKMGFPLSMSANALLEAVNLLMTYEEYKKMLEEIN